MNNVMSTCMFHRCFLSGASVPSKSRIVEAVCILLCQKYPETEMTSGAGKTSGFNNLLDRSFDVEGWRRAYLSRWKMIVQECNALRAWLFNSAGLMVETNLALYVINQTTLLSYHDVAMGHSFIFIISKSGTRTGPQGKRSLQWCKS